MNTVMQLPQHSFNFSKSIFVFIIVSTFSLLMSSPVGAVPTAELNIPSIGVSAPIVTIPIRAMPDGNVTWDTATLQMTVGYFQGTGQIGRTGNAVIGGHSELERGEADIFYNLESIQIDDIIQISAGNTTLTYTVVDTIRVSVDDLSVIAQTSAERLTLITCDIESFDADTGDYFDRLVVIAERIS